MPLNAVTKMHAFYRPRFTLLLACEPMSMLDKLKANLSDRLPVPVCFYADLVGVYLPSPAGPGFLVPRSGYFLEGR